MENDPLHILLADDDAGDRLLFIEAFEEMKINTVVHTVNNGMELMAFLTGADCPPLHMLFLDLNMPRKNGLECLKEIRSDKTLKEISIAIYSTSASEQDIEETFLNGANVYIKKPNDFNALKQALNKAVMNSYQYHETPFNKTNFLLRI